MSKWSETGILRKKQVKDNYDDLLVFGYACKLFRDDEKALYVDQGKHLIPWMADDSLKIDRYDGRGALQDLSLCEASKEGYDATRWLGLSESERKIEQLCDEERYYSLHTNEEEEALYKEEELKRQQAKEFQYSYDVPRNPEEENSQDSIPTCEEEVKPFVPPTELDVPVDINIPKTVKENTRIEKTALFVSKQGPQMEILIKAKQADNPQFNFMNQHDTLYKYYRHVLAAIKSGRYRPQSEKDEKEEERKEADQSSDEHYLHPSLGQPQAPPSVNVPNRLPTIPYKPTADCAYTQLVSRIQGSHTQSDSLTPPPVIQDGNKQTTVSQMSPEQQQQYYQYYYSMQYYEYYKQIAAHAGCDPQTILQNPQVQEQIQAQASHYAQAACNQYVQHTQSNPYEQIVTNLAPNIKANIASTVSSMPEMAQQPPPPPAPAPPPATAKPPEKAETKSLLNPLQSLVHYSSDSDENEESDTQNGHKDDRVTFKVPPNETALIIDKMANYVSKNGTDFESIVRSKGDPRFDFLNDGHEYNKYYKHKLEESRDENKVEVKSPVDKKEKLKEKKVIAPVSFSIKKSKEDSPKEIKSALPVEESDEEADDQVVAEIVPPQSHTPPPPPDIKLPTSPVHIPPPAPIISEDIKPQPPEKVNKAPEREKEKKKGHNGAVFDGDDPIFEMIDLTDDFEEKRDARRAEDKIKDKLATAAKEKMSRSKDRALQMERRKRAAMFLKLKNAAGAAEGETRTVTKAKEAEGSERSRDAAAEDRTKRSKEEILKIDDSESEEGEIRTSSSRKSSGKKKKSHKRKSSRSRSKHESKSSHHKRSKKRRRRSRSVTRSSSVSS